MSQQTRTNESHETSEKPKAGFGSFIRDIAIVLLLGAGIVYWYYGYQTTQKQIADLTMEARNKMNRHDLESLREAEGLYRQILELDANESQTLASMARTLYYQADHGLDTLSEAKTFLDKAEAQGAETPSRYAAEGYLKVANGDADAAVAQIKDWIEKGKAAPPVAHALSVAHVATGDYIEANRVARQAREADFSNVAIQLTMAEASHKSGQEKQAIKELSKIVSPSLNENHLLARAWLAALRAKNYGNLTQPLNHLNYVKEADDERKGPRTNGFVLWAKGELSLALGNADGALEKVEEARKILPDFPPLYDLEARAQIALGKNEEAVAAYREALEVDGVYRGIKWDLAETLSKMGDDAALALADELEKSDPAKYKGPKYLVFRAEHALLKGNLEEANELFTKAADEGDDPDILFGIAKVTFLEEKKKDKKADLERVGAAFQTTLEKKRRYPELHEYLAGISLWNYQAEGAHAEFEQAEKQYKALKRPIPDVVAFYNRAIQAFENADAREVRREAEKYANVWKEKKTEYLQSLQAT